MTTPAPLQTRLRTSAGLHSETASLMREAADVIDELLARATPADCNCGYGGFHEPMNKLCDAYREDAT